MHRRRLLTSIGATSLVAFGPRIARAARSAADVYEHALVFDANLLPPYQPGFPYPKEMIELVRRSGVTAIKTTLGGIDENLEDTLGEIAHLQRVIEEYPDTFMQVRKYSDFARAKRLACMGIVFSFEAVTMLADKVERIALFRNLGVRVMQLTYNTQSPFGMGVLGNSRQGLTPLGRKAVASMNQQGVAIDLSHSNEATSFDILKTSNQSVLITHAGCAAIHQHPRNKSDALLRAFANKGGVIGIYDLPYLAAPPRQPTLDDYMAHLTHALNVCGEDHVGIGSDSHLAGWDTSPAAIADWKKYLAERAKKGVAAPEEDDRPYYVIGLNTPRRAEVIADALIRRGYSARTAEKVLGSNFIDTLGRIWKA